MQRPTLHDLGWYWFRFGLISWGGMMAWLPRIEDEMVAKGWMSRERFQEAMATSVLVPGPTFVSLAGLTGYQLGGALGAAISLFSLMLPPTLLVTAAMLSISPELIAGPLVPVARGLQVAVAGILLGNAYRYAMRAPKGAWRGPLLFLLVSGSILAGVPVAVAVVGGVLLSGLLFKGVAG